MLIGCFVNGLIPSLAALSATSKEPKPTNCTFSPFFNSSVTTSTNAFNALSASFLDNSAFSAIAATNSVLFMDYILLNKLFARFVQPIHLYITFLVVIVKVFLRYHLKILPIRVPSAVLKSLPRKSPFFAQIHQICVLCRETVKAPFR